MDSYSVQAMFEANVKGFISGVRQAKSELTNFTEKNKETFDSFKKVGAASTAAGLAVGAGLGMAVKTSASFQEGMSKVQAVSGATASEIGVLSEKAREMGSKTKFSATESAAAFEYMALAGWKTEEMLDGISGVMDLAAASGTDLATTSDIVTDGLSAFGLQAKDSSRMADVLAAASANANTDVLGLGAAFQYVAPVAGALGFTIEDTATAIGLMSNAGIKGEKAGTALRTMMTNLAKPTKQMQDEMNNLGISLTDSQGDMKSFDDIMRDLRVSFADLDEAQQASAAATIFGKEAMSGALAVINASESDFEKLSSAINNSSGSAKEMAETMQANVMGSLTTLKSGIEEMAISLGNALLPAIQKMIDYVQSLVDRFNSLSDTTKTTIATIAGIAAVVLTVGGALLTFAGFIPAIVSGLTALGTVAATIAGAFTAANLPIVVLAGTLALVAAEAVKIANHLRGEAIPAIDDFGDGVSDNTKEAVKSFVDLRDKANKTLKEMAWGHEKVTQEMAQNMKEQQKAMTDNLLTAIKERQSKEVEETKNHFKNVLSLNSERQAEILAGINDRYDQEQAAVEEGQTRINEIIQAASDNNREITQAEANEILQIRNDMTNQAVEVMSESAEEQRLIYEQMKDNATEISAREAAEIVRNATEKKEKVIEEAKDQYDETYKWALRQRDDLGTISAEEAQEIIKEANDKKEEVIDAAKDTHENVVKEAQEQAQEHVKHVDWETGEIKSRWKIMTDDATSTIKDIGKSFKDGWTETGKTSVKLVKDAASGIKNRYNTMRSDAKEMLNNLVVSFKEGWTDVVTTVREGASAMVSATKKNISEKLQAVKDSVSRFVQAGKDLVKGLIDGIVSMGKNAVEAIAGVVNRVVEKAKSILGIASPSKVFKGIGEDTTKGFELGLLSRKNKVEEAMQSIGKSIKSITDKTSEEVNKINSKAYDEIKKIETRASQDINNIKRKATASNRKLTASEATRLQRIEQDSAEKINKIKEDASKNSLKEEEKVRKEKLEAIKLFINDKKSLEELSIIEEARIWGKSVDYFQEGTKERIEAQNNYKKSVEVVQKEIESINETHLNRMKRINDEYDRESNRLMEEYERQFESRVNSILSFSSLFDEFVSKMERSGNDLLNNLKSQVDGLKEWRSTLEDLMTRIDDESLMEELKAMGPKALGDLKALNKLSDRELRKFVSLYQERSELAVEQATTELADLKVNTELRMEEMRLAADEELEILHKDWMNSIATLTKTTDNELKDLQRIGRDAGVGLNIGLESMRGELIGTATSIANSIKSAMESALQIHSPSRWMRDHIGKNMMLGWIEGINSMESSVRNMTDRATDWMMPTESEYDLNQAENRSPVIESKQSGGVVQHITINSPEATSPAENARLIKQQSRSLALEMG